MNSALPVLALAFSRLFPSAKLVGGWEAAYGYSYTFFCKERVEDEALPRIESEMHGIVKKGASCEKREMVSDNAAAFFTHLEQPYVAKRARESLTSLVATIQLDELYDLCPPGFEGGELPISLYKIVEREREGDFVTLYGVTALSKDLLKEAVKRFLEIKERSHKRSRFFAEAGGEWLLKAEALFAMRQLQEWYYEAHAKEKFELVEAPSDETLLLYAEQCGGGRFAWMKRGDEAVAAPWEMGVMAQVPYTMDEAVSLVKEEALLGELISSLHFIKKTIIMFGFEATCHVTRVLGKKSRESSKWLTEALTGAAVPYSEVAGTVAGIEFQLVDAMGRSFPGPFLRIEKRKESFVVRQSLFRSLERFVALLVEHDGGQLPFKLRLNQVRLLPVKEAFVPYAEEVQKKLQAVGVRVSLDVSEETLGAKVHLAEVDHVAYVVVVGADEVTSGTIAYRTFGEMQVMKGVAVDAFLAKVQEELHRI